MVICIFLNNNMCHYKSRTQTEKNPQLYCIKMTQKGIVSSEDATLYFTELTEMAGGEFPFGEQTYF